MEVLRSQSAGCSLSTCPVKSTKPSELMNSTSILKPEIKPLVTFQFSRVMIRLILLSFLDRHAPPDSLFVPIEVHQVLLLQHKSDQAQSTDANQDFVAGIVVGRVGSSIYLRSDKRANLHDDVVDGCCDCALLDIECVLGDPTRDNRTATDDGQRERQPWKLNIVTY